MENQSQQKSVWRERWWFIARLFAAWAVVTALSGVILNPLSQLIHLTKIEIFLDLGTENIGLPLLPYSMRSIYFLVSGYIALRFFKEHWLKVGLGIPAISIALIFWQVGWNELLMSTLAEGLINRAPTGSVQLASLLSLLSPFYITVGVMARNYLPPGEFKPFIRRIRRWN